MNEVEKLADTLREISRDALSKVELTPMSSWDVLIPFIAQAILDVGYRQVEEVKLEGLTDETIQQIQREFTRFTGDMTDIYEGRAITQAILAKIQQQGKLYREVKETSKEL